MESLIMVSLVSNTVLKKVIDDSKCSMSTYCLYGKELLREIRRERTYIYTVQCLNFMNME